jgi:YD repeat-containing protein
MSTSQGNHIGYGEVYVSQTNNGYSKYKYYGSNGIITGPWTPLQNDVCQRILGTFCDPNLPSSPSPPISFDPMRGELASEAHFNQSGQLLKSSSYFPVWQNDSLITPGIISKFYVTGYQYGQPTGGTRNDPELNMSSGSFQPVGIQTFTEYFLQSAKKIKDSVVRQTYDPTSSNYLTTINANYYGSSYHHQSSQSLSISSKGEKLTANYKNAQDFRISNFNLTDQLPAYYNNLNSDYSYLSYAYGTFTTPPSNPNYYWERLYIYTNFRYMKAVDRQTYIASRLNYNSVYTQSFNTAKASADAELKPIFELQNSYQNPVIEQTNWKNSNLLHAEFNRYDYVINPAGRVFPNKLQSINLNSPTTTFTDAAVSGNTLVKDSRYTNEADIKFESGNMSENTGKDGVTTSYIWGYNNTLPIVKAIGVNYAILKSAYDAVNGDLTAIRSQSSLSNAFVSTYIYNPLVGMTSETDARGRTIYYEYDKLSRLILVRDHDNNIIKKICYNYAGQVENCQTAVTYYNVLASQTFTRNNCPACQTGSQVTYTVQAGNIQFNSEPGSRRPVGAE